MNSPNLPTFFNQVFLILILTHDQGSSEPTFVFVIVSIYLMDGYLHGLRIEIFVKYHRILGIKLVRRQR